MKTIFKISIGLVCLILFSVIVNEIIIPYSGYVSPSEKAGYSTEITKENNLGIERIVTHCNNGNEQACDTLRNIILPECNKLINNDYARENLPVCFDGRIQEVLRK